MNDLVWERYRERVRREHGLSRLIELHQFVEGLLAQASLPEAGLAEFVRSLDAESFGDLLNVLAMMKFTAFNAAGGGDALQGYPAWFAQFRQAVAAGAVTQQQTVAADRLSTLLGISEKATLMRQMEPPCVPAQQRTPAGPDPAVVAALEPLFARFSGLQARVGIADAALEAELSTLLSEYQDIRDRQQPDGADWKSVQWHYAMVLDSLARCTAIRGETGSAVAWFAQAAEAWDRIGESVQADDCRIRSAQAALAGGLMSTRPLDH